MGALLSRTIFLIDKFDPGLEDIFTVCYWEQRGGGLSYSKEVTAERMNFGQLTSDAMKSLIIFVSVSVRKKYTVRYMKNL
jgi:hypothetical protein